MYSSLTNYYSYELIYCNSIIYIVERTMSHFYKKNFFLKNLLSTSHQLIRKHALNPIFPRAKTVATFVKKKCGKEKKQKCIH